VNLNSCDLVQSQFHLLSDFEASMALDYLAEISEHLLPANEPNEHFFRLLATVLDYMHTQTPGSVWTAVSYFSLWATRLSGFLPDLASYPDQSLSDESRHLAGAMLRNHIRALPDQRWTKDTALDLRRFLIRRMEEHVERRFHTPAVLEGL
jgi:DNA repair protein RecO (recombination protein O)